MFKCYSWRWLIYYFVIILCIGNLYFMHNEVLGGCDRLLDKALMLSVCLIDVVLLSLLSLAVTWGRLGTSLWMTYLLSMVLSISNVVYSRFFYNYLSFDCFSVVGEFGISFYCQYADEAFRIRDVFYLISLIVFYLCIRRVRSISLGNHVIFVVGMFLTSAILQQGVSFAKERKLQLIPDTSQFCRELSLHPRDAISRRSGLIISQVYTLINRQKDIELTENEEAYIKSHFEQDLIGKDSIDFRNPKNVVFILVESYLSCVTDSLYDGVEITPFLNSLKQQPYVYYNGQMNSDISIGESSDGQFIYMTGMFPLEDVYTINVAKSKRYLSLPELLKRDYSLTTMITLPTPPDCWQQLNMCRAYGIDSIYSSYDVAPDRDRLTDKEVFHLAKVHQESIKTPFFDLILTISMHSPYDASPFNSIVNGEEYSVEFKNYLSMCHYTDQQIKDYFDWTRQIGIWDNTVFIIAADHQAHDYFLKSPAKLLGENLIPFFIVDTGRDFSEMYRKECSQIDVFTTLVEYLHLNSPWKGMGNNILNGDITSSTDRTIYKEMAARIIRSNYFEQYFK